MSVKKKISVILSLIWIVAWVYISHSSHNFLPVLYSSIPLGIIWGIYLCFKRKKYNPNFKMQYFKLPENAFFKDFKKLTTWYKIFLYVFILANTIASITYFDPNFFHSDKKIIQFIFAVAILAFMFSVVFMVIIKCLWLYRTTFNAHYLGAADFPYSPMGVVGWSIVPFRIYFIIRDLLKASQNPDSQWESQRTPWIIKFWGIWYFLVTIIIFFLSDAYGYLALAMAEILFLCIINSIFKNQILSYSNHMQEKQARTLLS